DQSRLQRVLRVRCEAHAKGLDGLRREPASLGIGQRLTAFARAELLFEIEGRRLERVIEAEALACGALESRVWLRQWDTRIAGELLHGLGKAQAFRLHDEAEDVTVLAARETVIEALLVVDGEGGR